VRAACPNGSHTPHCRVGAGTRAAPSWERDARVAVVEVNRVLSEPLREWYLLETTTVPGQLALFGSPVRSYFQQMRSLVS
jgi:hypothetical protein